MRIEYIILILAIHWIADFVLQKHEWSIHKSTSNEALISHTGTYSLCWISLYPLLGVYSLFFMVVTFVTHTITDYITSRINIKLWKENRPHDFFVSIGFDQLLHYTQLLLTFKFLYEYHN
jgi:hypothetical protein